MKLSMVDEYQVFMVFANTRCLCESYCLEWDIKLNPGKTKNLSFGEKTQPSCLLELNGSPIEWVTKCKYLGVLPWLRML